MTSLRKKKQKDPTPLEKAASLTKLAAHGLTAQRVARKGHRTYRTTKRLVSLAIFGAIVAVVAKKLKGNGDAPDTTASYNPPTTSSATPSSTSGPAAAATSTAVPQPGNGDGPAAADAVTGNGGRAREGHGGAEVRLTGT